MKPQHANDRPPSLRTDLIGGHFRSFRKAPTEFLTQLSKLGDVTFFRMGPQPGYFLNDPEMIRDLLVVNDTSHALRQMAALHPLGRLGTSEEIARPVLFLFSDAASFITGTDLAIDGGFLTQ